MRKSKIQAAETRQHIVKIAADAFRLNGITATGVVPLMAKAGLTQGGFYKHFDSKDQLVAEAFDVGVTSLVEQFETASAAGGKHGFMSIVDSYLSGGHKEDRAEGCPLAAMGSELVRADERTRQAASKGFNDLVEVISKSLERNCSEQARSRAVFAMAAMMGAVTMSRMMSDEAASFAVLNDVRQHLSQI